MTSKLTNPLWLFSVSEHTASGLKDLILNGLNKTESTIKNGKDKLVTKWV